MDIIIADAEFQRGAERIDDMINEIFSIIDTYHLAMEEILTKGICDVAINKVIEERLMKLSANKDALIESKRIINGKTKVFLENIEEADGPLYDY